MVRRVLQHISVPGSKNSVHWQALMLIGFMFFPDIILGVLNRELMHSRIYVMVYSSYQCKCACFSFIEVVSG